MSGAELHQVFPSQFFLLQLLLDFRIKLHSSRIQASVKNDLAESGIILSDMLNHAEYYIRDYTM